MAHPRTAASWFSVNWNYWLGATSATVLLFTLCDRADAEIATCRNDRPNILFIFTDDQSHRTVGCYPSSPTWVKTPNIDQLANEGLRFSAAYPAGAWCLPSRASFLTGRHPHGIYGMEVTRNPSSKYDPAVCRFWPAELRKAGYTTGFIGKWHLSEGVGHGREWDFSVAWNHAVPEKAKGYYLNQRLNFDGGPYVKVGGYSTDNYTKYAAEFIKRDHDKPWFLWLCYDAIHEPFTAAERHGECYGSECHTPIPLDIFPPRETKPAYMHQLSWWKNGAGAYEGQPVMEFRGKIQSFEELVRRYNRPLLAVDEGVGHLMKVLQESGQSQNTLIVFTSDQGQAVGQHGFLWKVAPYDANLKVPLIIRMPGKVAEGKVCHRPVGTLDVLATIFKITGAVPPWKTHGRDISELLVSPQSDWPHPVLMEHTRWALGHQTDKGVSEPEDAFQDVPWWIFLRQGRFKYIRTLVRDEIEELYDLNCDPDELINLAVDPTYRKIVEDYRQRMVRELERTDAPLVKNLPAP